MKASIFKLFCLGMLAICLSGCYHMSIDTKQLSEDIYLTSKSEKKFQRLNEFTAKGKSSWTLIGNKKLNDVDLAAILKDEISRQNGDAVINLTIKTQFTFPDALIGTISLFGIIYMQRSVFVSGTVVSMEEQANVQPNKFANLVQVDSNEKGEHFKIDGFINQDTIIR